MSDKLWTDDEIEYLVNHLQFDWLGVVRNYPKLAKELGRTKLSVTVKTNRLRAAGIVRPCKSLKAVLKYINENALFAETNQILNLDELSEELNVKRRNLERLCVKWRQQDLLPKIDMTNQFDLEGRFYSDAEDRKIIHMKKLGVQEKEIGQILGRSKSSINHRIDYLKKLGKFSVPGYWKPWEDKVILQNVEFDENGFVCNYEELSHLLQGRRNINSIRWEVGKLRKKGIITTLPKKGTTSIKGLEYFRQFNDARFAAMGWDMKQRKSQIVYTHKSNKKPASVAPEASK